MVIKIRLNRKKDWDRKIIDWLKGIPEGYRSMKVKEVLYTSLLETPQTESRQGGRDPLPRDDFSQKVSRLIKG